MLGLFSTLNLGTRSLATQRQGVEVAGHNLANVNNPAYARQRLTVRTSPGLATSQGLQGTGAGATGITRLRSEIVDRQITAESGIRGSLEAQQSALQQAQASLGYQIGREAEASTSAQSLGGANGLSDGLSNFFNAFHSLSTNPTSQTERQAALQAAAHLAGQFNQIDRRLGSLSRTLDDSLRSDIGEANDLLADIAKLNEQIAKAELGENAQANDLRDSRQQKVEMLATLVKVDTAAGLNGALNITIAGTLMVSGAQLAETLEAYDAGEGGILVRAAAADAPVRLAGGRIEGTLQARDGALASLRTSINSLAGRLITEVNAVHGLGFSLTGSTGDTFFTGSGAADIAVNQRLVSNPSLLQTAGTAAAAGDNKTALALARLCEQSIAALNGRTFTQNQAQTIAELGSALASVSSQLEDQEIVDKMLSSQRDSISGVSIDEEMADLIQFQKAFQASARLITTIDEMLDTIVAMKR